MKKSQQVILGIVLIIILAIVVYITNFIKQQPNFNERFPECGCIINNFPSHYLNNFNGFPFTHSGYYGGSITWSYIYTRSNTVGEEEFQPYLEVSGCSENQCDERESCTVNMKSSKSSNIILATYFGICNYA